MADRDFTKTIFLNKDKWFNEDMKRTSYSQIDAYSSCSLKWALKHILRMEEPWSDKLAFGNVYHDCWEAAINKYIEMGKHVYDAKVLKTLLLPVWTASFDKHFKDHNLCDEEYSEIKTMSYNSLPVLIDFLVENKFDVVKIKDNEGKMIPAQEVGVAIPIENPFTKQYRTDYYLLMYMDLIIRNQKGEVIILDHKTASRRYTQAKIDGSLQLALYDYGLSELLKQNGIEYKHKVGYDILLKQKKIAIDYVDKEIKYEDIKKALINVNMALDGISKCSFCPSTLDMAHEFCSFKKECLEQKSEGVDFKKIFDIMNSIETNLSEENNDIRPVEPNQPKGNGEGTCNVSADLSSSNNQNITEESLGW